MKTGTINLGAVREITGETPRSGIFTLQLLSANLSANTDFSFQLSVDGVNWDIAQAADTDVTGTLIANQAIIKQFDCAPTLQWKVVFAANASTGIVTYWTQS